jgi:hypothetical protein
MRAVVAWCRAFSVHASGLSAGVQTVHVAAAPFPGYSGLLPAAADLIIEVSPPADLAGNG